MLLSIPNGLSYFAASTHTPHHSVLLNSLPHCQTIWAISSCFLAIMVYNFLYELVGFLKSYFPNFGVVETEDWRGEISCQTKFILLVGGRARTRAQDAGVPSLNLMFSPHATQPPHSLETWRSALLAFSSPGWMTQIACCILWHFSHPFIILEFPHPPSIIGAASLLIP